MRYLNAFLLLSFVVLATLAALMTPSCVEMLLQPADDGEQRQILHKICQDTLARYQARYGDLPVEECPSERDRLIYTNARRILSGMENPSPDPRTRAVFIGVYRHGRSGGSSCGLPPG